MHVRADAVIELTMGQRAELEKLARSRRTPQAVAQRARIVLMTAQGIGPAAIGGQLEVSQPTVRKWRTRYVGSRHGWRAIHVCTCTSRQLTAPG